MNIPINIETLLTGRIVESERVEFKKSWNPKMIMRTITAFANDFENLGRGYIVVGIEEENGLPKMPFYGFPKAQFDNVQKELKLTEGKGTGLPTIKQALLQNGSPKVKYDTDGVKRRFFLVEIPIHSFYYKANDSHDNMLLKTKLNAIFKDNLSTLVLERTIKTLQYCKKPRSRIEILTNIELKNSYNSFKNNIIPALENNLLEMTLPNKPRSKDQKYVISTLGLQLLNNTQK